MLAARMLSRARPRLSAAAVLLPRLPTAAMAPPAPLQLRAYRHVKGKGAVQVGDGKNRAKK